MPVFMYVFMSILSRVFTLLAAAVLAMPLPAAATPRYTVIPLGGGDSWAVDINSLGQVAGTDYGGGLQRAFVHDGGELRYLGTLGGRDSAAAGINDLGQVAGNAELADGSWHGFVYGAGGMQALAAPAGSLAWGINNAGTVVGATYPDPGNSLAPHAFRSENGGGFTDLGTLPSGLDSAAHAINNHGDIVGVAGAMIDAPPYAVADPFLYRDGAMTRLGNFGGAESDATAINDRGQIVGRSGYNLGSAWDPVYVSTAFLYENGQMRMLRDALPVLPSIARDINNLGQVVGWDSLYGEHGFLYEDGRMLDLNGLIDAASGWSIVNAAAINDQGQIAARACRAGVCQAVRLDLVLSAVPEPSPAALLAAGLACGLVPGLRRQRGLRPLARRRPG